MAMGAAKRVQCIDGVWTDMDMKCDTASSRTSDRPSSTSVMCTAAFRAGYLDERTYARDERFGSHHIEPTIVKGYYSFGKPLSRLMSGSPTVGYLLGQWFVLPWAQYIGWLMDWSGLDTEAEKDLWGEGSESRSTWESQVRHEEGARESEGQGNDQSVGEGEERPPFSVLGCLIFWLGVPFCAYLGFLRHFLDLSVPFLARGSAFSRSRGGMEGQKCHLQEEEASEREKRHKMSSGSPLRSSWEERERDGEERYGSGTVEGGEGNTPASFPPRSFPSPPSLRSAALPDDSDRSSSAPSNRAKAPVEDFEASPPGPIREADGVVSGNVSTDSARRRFEREKIDATGQHWQSCEGPEMEGKVRKRERRLSISAFDARGGRAEHVDWFSDGAVLMLGLCLLISLCWMLRRWKKKKKICA